MDIHNLTDFFRLSAQLNLQLSATAVGRSNILAAIIGRRPTLEVDHQLLLQAMEYLDKAYGERRRRVGPMAVLHPLRAAALLVHALDRPTTLEILTELLHDKLEDITPESVGQEHWEELETDFQRLIRDIDPADEWYLMERLDWLTRRPHETYYQYIGRLLDNAHRSPTMVSVKLADRLDNTLDMRIALEDPIEGIDFDEMAFKLLYVNSFSGYVPDLPHPPASPLRGAHRLYQLFKNAVLLSLIRRRGLPKCDGMDRLFDALAIAGMKEAQRTALHIFGYHLTDVATQRALLMEVMDYVQSGGAERVTRPDGASPLDGLFATRFDSSDRAVRVQKLDELNEDKPMVATASLAFIVVFRSFLESPHYWVEGVSEEGISPQ